ncbi:YqeG family HAD IIIA-type phosphatase [Salinithrix halophila]|uniref:YqeG family HAD IIIA-type phosphatase n=1 Tax=Salinithrix halophila TaxID=1485204 RepID=A0ABV8JHI6_9BACL
MLKRIVPDEFVQSVYEIDFNELQRRGVKGAIVDLDNTLVESTRPDATPKLVSWLDQLQGMGFKVMIVSNNKRTRVSKFAMPLRVPYIHRARKPLSPAFKKAMRKMKIRSDQVVVIGDQLFTDVLGGNTLGLHTILVVPVSEAEGFFTKMNRLAERLVFRWMRQKGLLGWEDQK